MIIFAISFIAGYLISHSMSEYPDPNTRSTMTSKSLLAVHSNDQKEITEIIGSDCKNTTGEWFACSNSQCIKAREKCNGYKDCDDGTDEDATTCGDTYCRYENWRKNSVVSVERGFACSNGQCIKEEYRCNGEKDCYDGSDETTETCGANCEKVDGRWACASGQCIYRKFKCDGNKNSIFGCDDGSDETTETCGANCENVKTGGRDGGFACNNSQCIPERHKCDGFKDCDDGSDETTETCGANCEDVLYGGFACKNGQCIMEGYKCNGDKDCDDGSDENTETCGANCENMRKKSKNIYFFENVRDGGFACNNGQCIKEGYKCNGNNDCDDGSDEDPSFCDGYKKCNDERNMTIELCGAICENVRGGGFLCKSGQCISAEHKCAYGKQCYDGSDETTETCGVNCENVQGGGFACNSGQCIEDIYKCNGDNDCEDGGDEDPSLCDRYKQCNDGRNQTTEVCGANCENVRGGGFACNNGQCIRYEYKCSYGKQCDDGSDETTEVCGANCENVRGGGFACKNGQCVNASDKCDGSKHCDDGSDDNTETCGANCEDVKRSTFGRGFACNNGQCINDGSICSGYSALCDDGSDESTETCGARCENVTGGGFACSNG